MIVDIHHYVDAPDDLYYERSINLGERGGGVVVHFPHDPEIAGSAERAVAACDRDGVDVRLIAPQPHHLMTGETPPAFVAKWIANCNRMVAAQCALAPDRLKGLAALELSKGAAVEACLDGIDRAADEGFVGVLLNPDLGEGDGMTPALADPFWDPVYARLEALDLPALVVSAGCRDPREGYASHWITETDIALTSILIDPAVLDRFPGLKLIFSHGGGSVPYQIGRWRAHRPEVDIDAILGRLWFDTVIHAPASLRLLIETVGAERCLFGAERDGSCDAVDPATGRRMDDIKAMIDEAEYLSADQRAAILGGNAARVFTRLGAAR